MKKQLCHSAHSAFSLVEMLSVIAVIGIISAIAIPQISRINGSAREATAKRNAQNIASVFASAQAAGLNFRESTLSETVSRVSDGGLVPSGTFEGAYFGLALSNAEQTRALPYLALEGSDGVIYTGDTDNILISGGDPGLGLGAGGEQEINGLVPTSDLLTLMGPDTSPVHYASGETSVLVSTQESILGVDFLDPRGSTAPINTEFIQESANEIPEPISLIDYDPELPISIGAPSSLDSGFFDSVIPRTQETSPINPVSAAGQPKETLTPAGEPTDPEFEATDPVRDPPTFIAIDSDLIDGVIPQQILND